MMRRLVFTLICLAAFATPPLSFADEPAPTPSLQDKINNKYKNFFGPDSQSLLPLPKLELADWKALRGNKVFKRIYAEPEKFYNSKVYTFTLYQAVDDSSYYLDAKGGFWGMDELVYGPLTPRDLE